MTGDLIINGKDAWTTWKTVIEEGFLEAYLLPAPNKEYVENESRLENGKEVDTSNPKVDSRELNLPFRVHGDTLEEYITNFQGVAAELSKAEVTIQVPSRNIDARLIYKRGVSYARDIKNLTGKLSIKFDEPNPAGQ